MKILSKAGLTFDDIILVPKKSSITTRSTELVDLSSWLIPSRIKLKYPIISANMDTVTSGEMAKTMFHLGGLGIVHRFMTPEEQCKNLEMIGDKSFAVGCIGIGTEGIERLNKIADFCNSVLIDIAHGHSDNMIEQIKRVKNKFPHLGIIAGNVATAGGAIDLVNAGANTIKAGVGGGSLCLTRRSTGCGVPQITAIMEIAEAIKEINTPVCLIADGGIRTSGDIMKALAAGADTVMVGKLFAGTDETPGELFTVPELGVYKLFRGMASANAQRDWKGYVKSIEGEITRIPWKGPVKRVFDSIVDNLLSGMSYQNATNLTELRNNAEAIIQSVASVKEGTAHGIP